jgi:hypothetical protein
MYFSFFYWKQPKRSLAGPKHVVDWSMTIKCVSMYKRILSVFNLYN